MSIDEILAALFGDKPQSRMSPQDEAMASATLMRGTGPGMAETMDPTGGLTARKNPEGTVDVIDADEMAMEQEDAASSSPLRRRRAMQSMESRGPKGDRIAAAFGGR